MSSTDTKEKNIPKNIKIVTWNINGIRAAIKKDFKSKITAINPDILCLQEIKADNDIMKSEKGKTDFKVPGYTLYYNSCQIKKGYSGVALYVKDNLAKDFGESVTTKLDENIDGEGRYISIDINGTVVINCYYPQGGRPVRIPYKINFYNKVEKRVKELQKLGKNIVLTGDFNTTFADIDLARPAQNRKTTGCLPIERGALNNFINLGLSDIFRQQNPTLEGQYSYWDQITRARERNVGWRIDYFLVSNSFLTTPSKSIILQDILGSDHCPVQLDVTI